MENRPVIIGTGTIIKFFLFVAVFWMLFLLRDVVLAIFAAIFISSALSPLIEWFEDRKLPRTFGVVVVYLAIFALIGFIVLFMLPAFLTETSGLVSNIPGYISQIDNIVPLLDQSILEGYTPIIKAIADRISHATYFTSLNTQSFSAGETLFNSATTFAHGFMTFIVVIVLSFYFSVIKDGVDHFLRIITPLKHEDYVVSLWKRVRGKIGAWMQGQMFLGALVGSIIFLLLSIFKVKHALALGFIAGVLEIIPVFGPTLSAIPGVLFALLDGGFGLGLIALLIYVVVQQFENHIFYPLVVKKMVGISPILVIISLVVGYELDGFMGIILSIPLSVLLVEFFDDIEKRKILAKNK